MLRVLRRISGGVMRRRWWVTTSVAIAAVFVVLQVVGRVVHRARLPLDTSHFTSADVERAGGPAPEGDRRLVVAFHGVGGRRMEDVPAVIRESNPGSDLLMPSYSSSAFSNEQPLEIVRMYLESIDRAVAQNAYDRITIVGYSLGGLLARKVAVCANTGCPSDYRGRERTRAWATRIDRLVLLAGMNRGWATECDKVIAVREAKGTGYENKCRAQHMEWAQWLTLELAQRFAPTFGVGRLL